MPAPDIPSFGDDELAADLRAFIRRHGLDERAVAALSDLLDRVHRAGVDAGWEDAVNR